MSVAIKVNLVEIEPFLRVSGKKVAFIHEISACLLILAKLMVIEPESTTFSRLKNSTLTTIGNGKMKKLLLSSGVLGSLLFQQSFAQEFEFKVTMSEPSGAAAVSALHNGNAVGVVRYKRIGPVCPIEYMVLYAQYRQKGLEEKMISRALEHMKWDSCSAAHYMADRTELPMWQAMGFEPQESWRSSFFNAGA